MVVPVCDPGPDVAFECLDGTVEAALSSGSRQYRRLNRAGDRQANAALHRIVQTRLRCDPRTQEYCEGRLKQGKTRREIVRFLETLRRPRGVSPGHNHAVMTPVIGAVAPRERWPVRRTGLG
ncbi:transposase [Streptomyces sp. NPDC058228]|uniref:transposase n=1 Tax=unclassified Streptomyces TaxID=2593676 RepID=UPI0036E5FA27